MKKRLLREIMQNQERKDPGLAAKQQRLLDILAARKRSLGKPLPTAPAQPKVVGWGLTCGDDGCRTFNVIEGKSALPADQKDQQS